MAAGEHAPLVAVARPLEDPFGADERGESLPHDGVVAPSGTRAAASSCRCRRPPPEPPMYPDRSPPSVPCETPHPLLTLAEDRVGIEPDRLQEHLVEVAAAGDVDQRPNGDARRVIGRMNIVMPVWGLGGVRIGPRQQQPELGIGRVRRPDLLTVDDPLVAVADGTGAQRHEVGTGVGFGEQLAPPFVAGDERWQVPALLVLGAGGEQRRRGKVHADAERAQRRCVERRQLGVDGLGVGPAEPPAAVLGRQLHPGEPRRRQLPLQFGEPPSTAARGHGCGR